MEEGRRVSAGLSFLTDIGAILFFVSVLCVSSSKGASVTLCLATSESATPLLDGTAPPTHHGRAAASQVSSDGEIKADK